MMTQRGKKIAATGLLAGVLALSGLGFATAQSNLTPGLGSIANHGHGEIHGRGAQAGMAGRGAQMGGHKGMSGGGGMMSMDHGQHFIQMMIPHHEDAITMAGLALQQAERPEIRQLATDIERVQTEEIAQMRGWYQQWYDADVPAAMTRDISGMGGMHVMGGMAEDSMSLDGATPFDKSFIEQMVPHHEQAVMMASMALQHNDRPELRTLLQSIIASQTAEIARMRSWYQQWYGAELPTAMPQHGHGR